MDNIIIAEELTKEDIDYITDEPDENKKGLEIYSTLKYSDIVRALMQTQAPKKEAVLTSLRLSPEFSELTLSSPEMLTKFGIWPEVRGWRELQTMPRYFKGRPILVKACVNTLIESE